MKGFVMADTKVYCKNCGNIVMHWTKSEPYVVTKYDCGHEGNVFYQDTPLKQKISFRIAIEEKNKNNDCPDFVEIRDPYTWLKTREKPKKKIGEIFSDFLRSKSDGWLRT
jgi:hypothetical protein